MEVTFPRLFGGGRLPIDEYKAFFKKVGGNEGGKCHCPTRLDTYGKGCQNNCSYCYVKSLLGFRNLWNSDDPFVKTDMAMPHHNIWILKLSVCNLKVEDMEIEVL